ncbi:fibropellin-3 [Lingula anatina]|uniref:Fibropellin-3 n=1 Tax=Lingula anatina TaxID=7574 RepID=A0A1S3HUG1_LINAN|nr:fibropellin-3 [Lingula anatina]|eukprot:XP_013389181.1 fibropellin-3 [Lingula anatina]
MNVSGCNSNPCQNGGLCQETDENYVCICPPKQQGEYCEKHVLLNCDYVTCPNGGTCVETAESFKCVCPPGYTGPYCDMPHTP